MLRLTAEQGPDAGRIFTTRNNHAVVGRNGEIALHDRSVSAYHAILQIQPNGTVVVTDLNSESGTWMGYGERKAEKLVIKPGMCFKIGNTVLRLEFAQQPKLEIPGDNYEPGMVAAQTARANSTQPLRPPVTRANGTSPLWPQPSISRPAGTGPLTVPEPEVAPVRFTLPAEQPAPPFKVEKVEAPAPVMVAAYAPVEKPVPAPKPAPEPETIAEQSRNASGLELEFDPDILAISTEPDAINPVTLDEPEELVIPSPVAAVTTPVESAPAPRPRPVLPMKEVEPLPLPLEFRAIGSAYHSQGPVLTAPQHNYGLRIALISALMLALGLAILILALVQL